MARKSEYQLEKSEKPLNISDYHLEISEIRMKNLNIICTVMSEIRYVWTFMSAIIIIPVMKSHEINLNICPEARTSQQFQEIKYKTKAEK